MKVLIILLFIIIIESFEKSDVYFTKEISSEKVLEMFQKLNITLNGKIGLKVHTGERNGPYYLRPSFLKNIYDYTQGTFIESNVAYTGSRYTTELHKELLKLNGWSEYRTVIMDENENNDKKINVNNYLKISENIVGEHLYDFDSCIVLSHFKGHSMGGFGGALKQLSIGFASRAGKTNIHTGGTTQNYRAVWSNLASQIDFTTSKSCDCAGSSAPTPKIRNIGILSSLDPVAIDKACYDLIVKENTDGSKDWVRQAETKLGLNTLDKAVEHGIGSLEYNLINIDEDNTNISDEKEDETESNNNEKDEDEESVENINNIGYYFNSRYIKILKILALLFILI